MNLFYTEMIEGNRCIFSPEESHHIVRVLRLSRGDTIMVTDGKGHIARGIVEETNPAACRATLAGLLPGTDTRSYRLHIAISPLQNSERLDWFVEKATEIGIDEITPVTCRYTTRKGVNINRLRKLAISAMKQSLKTHLPVIDEPVRFSDFVRARHYGIRMIAWCGETIKETISGAYRKGENAVVMIGPEGDFSPEEAGEAISFDFKPVTLGNSRLRTETAGIAVCHSIYFMNM